MPSSKVTLRDVYKAIEDFRDEVRETYVTKGEFLPVKMIAYGIVGTASTAVLIALVAKVVAAIAP